MMVLSDFDIKIDKKPWDKSFADSQHGTRDRYNGDNCRCTKCRNANNRYYHEIQARKIEVLKELGGTAVSGPCPGIYGEKCEHGTHLRKDSTGGVCAKCRIKAGGTGIVNADKAQAHILKLGRKGVGYRQVAESAGVSATLTLRIRRGYQLRITGKTERSILNVDTSARADSANIHSAPSRALIQKILQKGYSRTELARRLGSKAKYPVLQVTERKRITVKSAHRIQKLYDTILGEEREEAEILKEMIKFCTKCGRSHGSKNKLRLLQSALPATSEIIKERYFCFYGGGASKERALFRDLNSIGATKDGPRNGKGQWRVYEEKS